jgi:hypothetical protein
MNTRTAIISGILAPLAMFAGDLPTPSWLAIPQKELTVKMSAIAGVIAGTSALWSGPGLSYFPSGTVIKNGDRVYRAESNGCMIVWTTIEGATNFFPFPCTIRWSDTNILTATNWISQLGQMSLQRKGGGSIIFREPKVLAVCSSVLAFEQSGQTNRFVIVSYGFCLKNTEYGGAGVNYTFESKNTTFWPYSKDYLTSLTKTPQNGDALYHAARWLLSTFEQKK